MSLANHDQGLIREAEGFRAFGELVAVKHYVLTEEQGEVGAGGDFAHGLLAGFLEPGAGVEPLAIPVASKQGVAPLIGLHLLLGEVERRAAPLKAELLGDAPCQLFLGCESRIYRKQGHNRK